MFPLRQRRLLSLAGMLLLLLPAWVTCFSAVIRTRTATPSTSLLPPRKRTTRTLLLPLARPTTCCSMSSESRRNDRSSNHSRRDKNDTALDTNSLSNKLQEHGDDKDGNNNNNNKDDASPQPSVWQSWLSTIKAEYTKRPPPLQVDDLELVLFDVFLLVNLVVSIDVWVVHRMQFVGTNIAMAINEGCLLSCCWLLAGLWTGAFLYSAVDGHWPTSDDRAGPAAAARLALQTFVNMVNLRLVIALVTAVVHHRPALDTASGGSEALLPAALGLGIVLMPAWRWLHSTYTPRL